MAKKRGFTLVELLIVIAVIAILATVVYVALDPAERLKESRDNQRIQDINNIAEALKLYSLDHDSFPKESDHYNGFIGIGGNLDTALQPYLSEVPADPKHDGSTYYYYYDAKHWCRDLWTFVAGLTVYTFESEEYKNNYANLDDYCPTGWGVSGGATPDYVIILASPDL